MSQSQVWCCFRDDCRLPSLSSCPPLAHPPYIQLPEILDTRDSAKFFKLIWNTYLFKRLWDTNSFVVWYAANFPARKHNKNVAGWCRFPSQIDRLSQIANHPRRVLDQSWGLWLRGKHVPEIWPHLTYGYFNSFFQKLWKLELLEFHFCQAPHRVKKPKMLKWAALLCYLSRVLAAHSHPGARRVSVWPQRRHPL